MFLQFPYRAPNNDASLQPRLGLDLSARQTREVFLEALGLLCILQKPARQERAEQDLLVARYYQTPFI